MNDLNQQQNQPIAIPDGEWIMIHCDTFISDRDRILLRDKAFMIDRDFTRSVDGAKLPKQSN